MKQFNLQEYLAHPEQKIVTRDGKKVRIICTDAKSVYPVIGLVDNGICGERLISCQKNGRESNDIFESANDLFFAPTKHTDYINLYHNQFGYFLGGGVYTSEENAKSMELKDEQYITTIKVEWEE